jgi:hypothetical protein
MLPCWSGVSVTHGHGHCSWIKTDKDTDSITTGMRSAPMRCVQPYRIWTGPLRLGLAWAGLPSGATEERFCMFRQLFSSSFVPRHVDS